jgi:ATP-dependent exoDNAse (exonuclease V) alpha subunit
LEKPDMEQWEKVQERNLKYVAVTRALQELYLVKSEQEINSIVFSIDIAPIS